ncbi:alkaline phosphatase family protein [Bradyrhizobium diazoefficiens]|uniref:phospholipase C n=1 Tax=Bradyrhizobium diazoefficiens TaxID=1355477 RepID=UPI001B8C6891|nr:alkaline phosphatase family protein [Bradyrhizobium diazoefficiens]MBR0863855.1 alkaline phosphatase family protein [Bradyrhizobium diazoefficiens]MBR0888486.1 alkaline phosphatase family protein [Bradyrhizobium diazoefficiens]MBR0920306.1 alkaline phosphatase family protein [Bradyrhizobium diazoefficiens]
MKSRFLTTAAIFAAATALACAMPVLADDFGRDRDHDHDRHRHPHDIHTETPIKHLVIIFNENRSFDHYFATYPNAANPSGSIPFVPKPHTPKVNNLVTANLLVNNPNNSPANGTGATDPFRLDRTQANTRSQNHAYTPEQQAVDNGKEDLFPKFTGRGTAGGAGAFGTNGQVMGYFDGNTVTAFWNYAQHFAMSDNHWTDTFGPSTPGMLEVISGQTNGAKNIVGISTQTVPDGQGGLTLVGDTDPGIDACSSTTSTILMDGKNIGDLLNAEHISWGSFMGGFDLTLKNANGTTGCARSTFSSTVNGTTADYIPHHAWFQYYKSTANPTHARPSSVHAIGHTHDFNGKVDPANHNYDLEDFYAAVKAGHFPAVSYIKMPAFQDGHAGYSDPLDEQVGNVELINFLQKQPEWRETAVIITYDDSDGWYDHQYVAPKSASYDPTADQVNGPGLCGLGPQKQPAPKGLSGKPVNGRCGPGTRVPFIVVSPYARTNFVSHTYISQASVVRFIEDNWLRGPRLGGGSFDASAGSIMDLFDFDHDHRHDLRVDALFLDPTSGTVMTSPPDEHHHH